MLKESADTWAAPRLATNHCKKASLLLPKVVVTLALCWWISAQVGWEQFWQTLSRTSVWILMLVVVLRLFGVTISALKWQQLLAVHGVRYPLSKLHGWYLISLLLNQLLPSNMGGDAYRIFKTYRNPRARVVSVLAVFVENVTAMFAILLAGYFAAVILFFSTGDQLSQTLVVFGTISMVIAAPILAYLRYSTHPERFAASKYCPDAIRSVIQHAGDYRSHGSVIWSALLLSFVFHGLRILTTWMTIYALGVGSSLTGLAVALLVVHVAGMAPISLAGLGVMEGSFVYVMSRYGVTPEAGLITMLLLRAQLIPMSLIGSLIFHWSARAEHASQ